MEILTRSGKQFSLSREKKSGDTRKETGAA
jgi:hypothetical protein